MTERMEWQPIETAPKNGTMMLLWFPYRGIRLGAWMRHGDVSYPFVWKDPHGDILVRGWKDDDEPTHWMGMPEPPASDNGEPLGEKK